MILLNSKANFKQALQEEPSLTNRYVRRNAEFSASSGVDTEIP